MCNGSSPFKSLVLNVQAKAPQLGYPPLVRNGRPSYLRTVAMASGAEKAELRTDAPSVELRGVSKRFGELLAVDDLSLDLGSGEFFTLLGPSGCGKTTTLRMIAGFEQPSEGEIRIE